MNIPAIAVHGGSGTIASSIDDPKIRKSYLDALREALEAGFSLLTNDGTALESVKKAVTVLEDCELFNAGKGSVFTSKGDHEMDAAIMDGKTLDAGAVAGIKGIKNPVLFADDIMKNTPFVFLAGNEAMEYARRQKYEFLPDSYFFTQLRYDQWTNLRGSGDVSLDHSSDNGHKFGTVGAVAVDSEGNLAAATSTGGMTNKAWGRVGDSPMIGAGTYAKNQTCAVSCTGHGEYFIRGVVAYDVSCLMEYGGMSLKDATNEAIFKRLKKMGGEGGLIAIDAHGNIYMPFNTEGMYRGLKNNRQTMTQIL
ncbi:isoaspartyl peptidase/L-asparaginase [Rhodohalobacter sp.]|uniref:isoaspartyl peptidase/L-asparaginase family protein n=1 Tax=Rhodohalobacter sp. TaxID=1974210 RepID=UPI002ACECF66|nr:isoaspartyl peptidase/L-asparaginase [Rhodohalobacter sp.]MDZ7755802.1 isoaspartyl peptidase/L-asparaginase [Rhodohalobacter sp.]